MSPSQQEIELLLCHYNARRLDLAEELAKSLTERFPSHAFGWKILGSVFQQTGRVDDALLAKQHAVRIAPNDAEAHSNLGVALKKRGRLTEAEACYRKAILLKPDFASGHSNLGVALHELGRLAAAEASFRNAIFLKPEYAEPHNNLGNVLKDAGRLEEAEACFRQAIRLNPSIAEAHSNLSNILNDAGRLKEAEASCREAIRLRPKFVDAHKNLGNTLSHLQRLDEALASYDKALEIDPDSADARWNKSLLLLLMGRYLAGWELYEWRLEKHEFKDTYYTFPQPAWRGQEGIRGKSLLIHAEQGFGDVIQFCRYLPQVKELGAEIILEVHDPLVSLISTLNCPMTVVAKGASLPRFDAYCPLMSLPYVFKTTVDTIPAKIPYLRSDKFKVRQWQERLGRQAGARVGLVWAGSGKHKNDIRRSVRLEDVLPLIDLPVEWHSLQKECRQHDSEILGRHPQIQQHGGDLEDFSDTAALIDCLDLVITVDTSVAHVAGALGKPVWILLPFAPDYRWMLEREDSPWYPSARLFRQPSLGDWQGVIALVKQALCNHLA